MWSNRTPVVDDDDNDALGRINETSVAVDWDDWDVSLWTPEQRRLLERGAIPREVHVALGVLLALIVLFGVAANSTILYVFSRLFSSVLGVGPCLPLASVSAAHFANPPPRNK